MTPSHFARRMLLIVVVFAACASHRSATVVRRFHAAEANQGVAVDANFFYAIDNASTAKGSRSIAATDCSTRFSAAAAK